MRITRESERLKVEAHPNGKAKTPVKVFFRDGREAVKLDIVDLANRKARDTVVEQLPPDYREEADALVEAVACEVIRTRGSAATPEPSLPSLDPEPWSEPVEGAALLADVAGHLTAYVYFPPEFADAVAAWCVLTWGADWVRFAPLLVLLSASKRCGKTLLLNLVSLMARRGLLTSANGITPPVLFRLQDREHRTFCIDEAEKLAGRHADPDLVGLLNIGYRRGAVHLRCDPNNNNDVTRFDAFGFRALAAIGLLWDTILDRALVIHMERKPKTIAMRRLRLAMMEDESRILARRCRRFMDDHREAIEIAIDTVERPMWLTDRDCDNWAGLFAIAAVAGDDWPDRLSTAARKLAEAREDDGDEGERLVHDLRTTFANANDPPVIASGELCTKLNAIETSPWGAKRDGRGLAPHELARQLKSFKVKPRQHRHPSTGAVVRGYWLADLLPLFGRYPNSVPLYHSGHVGEEVPPSEIVAGGTESQEVIDSRAQTGGR